MSYEGNVTWATYGRKIRETADAVLLSDVGGGDDLWIPKSVIIDRNDEHVGIKKWWADKNDIESEW